MSFAQCVLDSMTSGIVGIDGAGTLVAFNAGARRILGCPDGEVLGRDCREVLAVQPGVTRLLIDALERRTPLSRAELLLEGGQAGSGRTIGFTLCPVSDRDGRPCGAAMIFRDLAPIERRDEHERLRERLAALGQMAADLAHEIRNPLAGMEVLAGLLRRRLVDRPEEQALVSELVGELRTVAGTVTASLEFVRPLAPVCVPVDATQLLEDALGLARARVPFAGSVEREFDPEAPSVLADAEQLKAALVALLTNALEAMAEGGAGRPTLKLRVGRREGDALGAPLAVGADRVAAPAGVLREVELAVCDSGPGVPPELREKIFYPFFTTKRRGSGIGLAMAQKIVSGLGGHIELESGSGGGSTFQVRLPPGPRGNA